MTMARRIAASLLSSALVLAINANLVARAAQARSSRRSPAPDGRGKPKFQSAEADFRWDLYERVVKETTTQTGTIYFKKAGQRPP